MPKIIQKLKIKEYVCLRERNVRNKNYYKKSMELGHPKFTRHDGGWIVSDSFSSRIVTTEDKY